MTEFGAKKVSDMSDEELLAYATKIQTYKDLDDRVYPIKQKTEFLFSALMEKTKASTKVFQQSLDQVLDDEVFSAGKPDAQTIHLLNLVYRVLTYDYSKENVGEDVAQTAIDTLMDLQSMMAVAYESSALPLFLHARHLMKDSPILKPDLAVKMLNTVKAVVDKVKANGK